MVYWLLPLVIGVLLLPRAVPFQLPASPAPAVQPKLPSPTERANTQPRPPIAAASAAVLDGSSGVVLYTRAEERPLPLASITKLMTALVVLDTQPRWQDVVTIQASDQRVGGRQWLQPGDRVTVEDLFQLMLVASANEAAVALARSTGLSEPAFVAAMNRKAAALGLPSARFADPAGLEASNVGSARDVARLIGLAVGDDGIRRAVASATYAFTLYGTTERREAVTTNHLLAGPAGGAAVAVIGGKTGYLDEAGYNFAGVVEQSGRRISVAVLGVASEEERWQTVRALIRWVYATYEWPHLGG